MTLPDMQFSETRLEAMYYGDSVLIAYAGRH